MSCDARMAGIGLTHRPSGMTSRFRSFDGAVAPNWEDGRLTGVM